MSKLRLLVVAQIAGVLSLLAVPAQAGFVVCPASPASTTVPTTITSSCAGFGAAIAAADAIANSAPWIGDVPLSPGFSASAITRVLLAFTAPATTYGPNAISFVLASRTGDGSWQINGDNRLPQTRLVGADGQGDRITSRRQQYGETRIFAESG